MATCPLNLPKRKQPRFTIDDSVLGTPKSKPQMTGITPAVLSAATASDAVAAYIPEPELQRVVNDLKLLCLGFEPRPVPKNMYSNSWMISAGPEGKAATGSFVLHCMGSTGLPTASSLKFSPEAKMWKLKSMGRPDPLDPPDHTDHTDPPGHREHSHKKQQFTSLQSMVKKFLTPLLAAGGARAYIPPVVVFEWVRHPRLGGKKPRAVHERNTALFSSLMLRPSSRLALFATPFSLPGVGLIAFVNAKSTLPGNPSATFMVFYHEPTLTWALFDPTPTAAWARMSQCLDVLLGTLVMDLKPET
jgi:hypothetical protein